MNARLISLLKANMGAPLNPDLAADIMVVAQQIPTLISFHLIDKIQPEQYGEFAFAVEKIEDIADEIKPLHLEHWRQTESHRHGLPFSPDYGLFVRYEHAGRYVLFTLRHEGKLLGNCALYISRSAHTGTLIAKEDTLFLMKEARKGRTAMSFVAFVENALRQIGAGEINITVKTINTAGRFFRLLGYRHIENGYTKILGGDNA